MRGPLRATLPTCEDYDFTEDDDCSKVHPSVKQEAHQEEIRYAVYYLSRNG